MSPGIKRNVVTSAGPGACYNQNYYVSPFNVGFAVYAPDAVATVQHTFDDIWDMTNPNVSAVWFNHEFVVSVTGNVDGNYAYPISGIRVLVNVLTSGSVVFTHIPAGIAGN